MARTRKAAPKATTFQNGTTYEQTLVEVVDERTVKFGRSHSWTDAVMVLTNPAYNQAVRLAKQLVRNLQGTVLTLVDDGDAALPSYTLVLPEDTTLAKDAAVLSAHLDLSAMCGEDRIEYHRELSRDARLLRKVKAAGLTAK
jgi:hypothetical protein